MNQVPTTQYERAYKQEIEQYAAVTNVRDLPKSFAYYSANHLWSKICASGFSQPNDLYAGHIRRVIARRHANKTGPAQILSIGAGNCDIELEVANLLRAGGDEDFVFTCLDINGQMLERGRTAAEGAGFGRRFVFLKSDIRGWQVGPQYDVVIASHSLHHVVDLELLFSKIYDSLDRDGWFLVNDMIGRNGHMRWPEAEKMLRPLWRTLQPRHQFNQLLKRAEPEFINFDCSKVGFEGIRAQDILPLLLKTFYFERFIGFANLITPFVDRAFGHNFDLANPWDRNFINYVGRLDDQAIDAGLIKPTQMIASLTKTRPRRRWFYGKRSPEFCVRYPDA